MKLHINNFYIFSYFLAISSNLFSSYKSDDNALLARKHQWQQSNKSTIKRALSCPQFKSLIPTPGNQGTLQRSKSLNDKQMKAIVASAIREASLTTTNPEKIKASQAREQAAIKKYNATLQRNHYLRMGCVAGMTFVATQAPKVTSILLGDREPSRFFGGLIAGSAVVSMIPTILTVIAGAYGVYKFDHMIHAEERKNYKELRKSLDEEISARKKGDEDVMRDCVSKISIATNDLNRKILSFSQRHDTQSQTLTHLLTQTKLDIEHAQTDVSGMVPKIEDALRNNAETKAFLTERIFPALSKIETNVAQMKEREEKYPDPLDYNLDRMTIPLESKDSDHKKPRRRRSFSIEDISTTRKKIDDLSQVAKATFKKTKKEPSNGVTGFISSVFGSADKK